MGNSRKTVVVTGGAGYLGRCATQILTRVGYRPIVLDNFSSSCRDAVSSCEYFELDLTDYDASKRVFAELGAVHAVMHFAAKALVGESVEKPRSYFANNLMSAVNVAELCGEFKIRNIIHSSSCSVYGVPERIPIEEGCIQAPVSPYGESKLGAERVFWQYRMHRNARILNLRYFNPAGALGLLGEKHQPETHLVPKVVEALIGGRRVCVFGRDYDTPDGTCIRDFIHVSDLLKAHVMGMEWLERQPESTWQSINLGSGRGYSVLEVIRAAENVIGREAEIEWLARRVGDPPVLVANIEMAKRVLGWQPARSLSEMIEDHYSFIKRVS